MTAAAEHRYAAFAAREATSAAPSHNEQLARDLNAMPRDANAQRPFGDIVFVNSHGGWFAECPKTGFGYFYPSLRQAVRAWRVAIFIDGGRLIGQPA